VAGLSTIEKSRRGATLECGPFFPPSFEDGFGF
jgi:hypothetical protein